MNVSAWCTKIIRASFSLLFVFVPLILTPWNYELFEYNKMMITYALTAIILGTWVIQMLIDRQIKIVKTPLDIPLWLFVGSQLISTIFSTDPHVSWMGYYSRFNGGMWSIFSYALLYHAFVTHFVAPDEPEPADAKATKSKSKTQAVLPGGTILYGPINSLLKTMLFIATIVAAYGIAERLGIDKHLWVQDVQNRVFSSLGQPNWLAAYLVALTPLGIVFGLQHLGSPANWRTLIKGKYIFWSLISVLFFVTLLSTRSRSGLIGLAVADVVFWAAYLRQMGGKAKLLPLTLLHVLLGLIVFVNGSNISQIDDYFSLSSLKNRFTQQTPVSPATSSQQTRGPLLEVGGTESGTIRKYVWEGAVLAWKSSVKTALIGTGTETFAFTFYRFRPVGHNLTSEWDFLYNKAHNEYLNYLATTGALGLGTYLLFIGTCIVWVFKRLIASQKEGSPTTSAALFAGWTSILVTNFFGFSVVIVQLMFFIFPGIIYLLLVPPADITWRVKKLKAAKPLFGWFILAALVLQLVLLVIYWHADTLYATAYRLSRAGNYFAAQKPVEQALALNPLEPVYHDELANTLSVLSVAAYEQQNATAAASFAKRSMEENDQAIRISPNNVNFWKTRTKIYYAFATYDPSMNKAAIEALTRARELSPNDPKIVYNLAILEGHDGNNEVATTLLQKAIELKPNYHDAYYALYVFYNELKKPDEAIATLEKYLKTVDPKDQKFNEILGKK